MILINAYIPTEQSSYIVPDYGIQRELNVTGFMIGKTSFQLTSYLWHLLLSTCRIRPPFLDILF